MGVDLFVAMNESSVRLMFRGCVVDSNNGKVAPLTHQVKSTSNVVDVFARASKWKRNPLATVRPSVRLR